MNTSVISPYNSKINYPCSIGIEYAMVPRGVNPDIDITIENKLKNVVKLIDSHHSKSPLWKKLIYKSHKEGGKIERGAVEYSSKPLGNIDEVRKFYDYVNSMLEFGEKSSELKFVANTTSKGVYIEGGGGHLHFNVSLPDKQKSIAFRRNIAIFMLNNPIVQWCMAEYCDDDILTSTYYNALEREMRCKISKFSSQLIEFHLENYSSGWGRAPVQIRTVSHDEFKKALPTVEFRCLAAPTSFQHLVDNIDLCCAIWNYCLSLSSGNHLANLEFDNVAKIEEYYKEIENDPAKEWEYFIRSMNLDYKRYKKYLKNFQWRKEHGMFYSYEFAGLE